MDPSMWSQLVNQMLVLKASELDKISEAFATELIANLDRFNTEHPEPIISTESSAPTNMKVSENFKAQLDLLLPTPQKFRRTFQSTFCRYAASRCIIIPE
jgi:hypothetical protein